MSQQFASYMWASWSTASSIIPRLMSNVTKVAELCKAVRHFKQSALGRVPPVADEENICHVQYKHNMRWRSFQPTWCNLNEKRNTHFKPDCGRWYLIASVLYDCWGLLNLPAYSSWISVGRYIQRLDPWICRNCLWGGHWQCCSCFWCTIPIIQYNTVEILLDMLWVVWWRCLGVMK